MTDIPAVLKQLGSDSVLLVTDGPIREIGLTEPLERALAEAGIACAVFETIPNPTTDVVERAVELCKASGCSALIGFGGGSSMDTAKAVGARTAAHEANPLYPVPVLWDASQLERFYYAVME